MQYQKTIIGVLASHDDKDVNCSLVRLFNSLANGKDGLQGKAQLIEDHYRFVFTGGTFQRIIEGKRWPEDDRAADWDEDTASWLRLRCHALSLPPSETGGVTLLANLVAWRQCSILWALLSPSTLHWIKPDNAALLRICDHCRITRLMNPGSIIEWIQHQAVRDVNRNLQPLDLKMHLAEHGRKRPLLGVQGEFPLGDAPEPSAAEKREVDDWKDPRWENRTWEQMTIALIAHDDMKQRMVEFALDFATELAMFGRILATGTTGKEIGDAVPGLTERVRRCHSGPKGGDIEIATEILLGYCQVVIFFVDSQHPHPHPDDIRTVFGACMARPLVRMITNEIQAREWMETVVRPGLTTP